MSAFVQRFPFRSKAQELATARAMARRLLVKAHQRVTNASPDSVEQRAALKLLYVECSKYLAQSSEDT